MAQKKYYAPRAADEFSERVRGMKKLGNRSKMAGKMGNVVGYEFDKYGLSHPVYDSYTQKVNPSAGTLDKVRSGKVYRVVNGVKIQIHK